MSVAEVSIGALLAQRAYWVDVETTAVQSQLSDGQLGRW